VRAEINDDIRLRYQCAQVVALVNLADDLQVGVMAHAGEECPPHTAFGTSDDNLGHASRVMSDP
jgi:hypothetical protein